MILLMVSLLNDSILGGHKQGEEFGFDSTTPMDNHLI